MSTQSTDAPAAEFTPIVQAAHILDLQRQGVIDITAGAAILRAIDTSRLGDAVQNWSNLEDRVEGQVPAEIAGAAALGRTRTETIATALRMSWRVRAVDIGTEALNLRSALAELAQAHSVTVMGAFVDHRVAAPTTLGHFLGGVIGGLETVWPRLLTAIDSVDRSPFGAGLMVGEVYGTDRDAIARLLGFDGTIQNTLDAAGSVEDIVALMEALAAQSAVIRRFVSELLAWIRTDPTSFFIDERWESVPEPGHAAHAVSARLQELEHRARHTGIYANGAVELLRAQPYGPIGVNWTLIARSVDGVLGHAEETIALATRAVREALIVNRAYLANRAGRLYSTASDLAAFLMEDQQLNPAAAQRIAGLAVARLKEQSLEASQITPDVIDAAAVMVIGQELKVEMETLGRYIAPRRYIERRDVLGSPKADRTRAWLAGVDQRMIQQRTDLLDRTRRWSAAIAAINTELAAAAEVREN